MHETLHSFKELKTNKIIGQLIDDGQSECGQVGVQQQRGEISVHLDLDCDEILFIYYFNRIIGQQYGECRVVAEVAECM